MAVSVAEAIMCDRPHPEQDVFFLEENGQLILPYVPASYLSVNSAKILDGLFIGNKDAAIDLEFITSNKITHIINCVGHLLPNSMQRYGVQYLSFPWVDSKTTTMFDAEGKTLNRIMSFIQSALSNHNGVLIFSVHGKSRSCCVAAAFLMQYFGWSLKKCLEFIQFKRADINPKQYFLRQLQRTEKSQQQKVSAAVSSQNDDAQSRWLNSCQSHTELVARNTFLNGHYIKAEHEKGADFKIYEDFASSLQKSPANSTNRLRWVDEIDPKSSLELSGGVEYSNSPSAKASSSAGPVSILKTPPPSPDAPIGEDGVKTKAAPPAMTRQVKTAWNGDGELSGIKTTTSMRPSSAQSEHEDHQAYNLDLGRSHWRNQVGQYGVEDSFAKSSLSPSDKYRKLSRASSVANAATVSSLAKMKQSLKYRSFSPSSSTVTKATRRLKSRSNSAGSSIDLEDNWMDKLDRMSLSSMKNSKRFLGSAVGGNAALSVNGRRPASGGHIKSGASSLMRSL